MSIGHPTIVLIAALLQFVATAAVADSIVIRPGKERAALGLLAPYVDGGPVGPDATLAGIRIEQQRLVVILATVLPPRQFAEIELRPLRVERRAAANAKTGEARRRAFGVRVIKPVADLTDAVSKIRVAIATNDDGTFFDDTASSATSLADAMTANGADGERAPDPRDVVPLELEDARFSIWDAWSSRLAALDWLVLIWALLMGLWGFVHRLLKGPDRLRLVVGALAIAFVFGNSMATRRPAPMWPLHANNHAYEDITAALGGDGSGPAVQRHVVGYGASWLVAQRAAVGALGDNHDGLAAASAWFVSAAIALAVIAAFAAGSSWWLALIIGVAVSWLPLTIHVGHSESTLSVAMFVSAACLYLAGRASTWPGVIGLLAALWLLASGHVIGPVLAGGFALVCFGLSLPSVLVSEAGEPTALGGWIKRHITTDPRRISAIWLLLLVAGPTAALVMRVITSAGQLGARLEAAGSLLPVPGNPYYYSLWLMESAPAAIVCLAVAGVVAIGVAADERPQWTRQAAAIGTGVGLFAIGGAGLLVCASLSDGLRYQSTLTAPFIVLASYAPGLATGSRLIRKWAVSVFIVAAAAVATLNASDAQLATGDDTGLDAQTRAYHYLRRQLDHLRGDIWLLQLGRTSERGAVLDVPAGRLSADGPVVHRLHVKSFLAMCDSRLPLPGRVYLFFDPACSIDGQQDELAAPCAKLERFVDVSAPGTYGTVQTAPRELQPKGLRGEFLDYRHRTLPWRFVAARCP